MDLRTGQVNSQFIVTACMHGFLEIQQKIHISLDSHCSHFRTRFYNYDGELATIPGDTDSFYPFCSNCSSIDRIPKQSNKSDFCISLIIFYVYEATFADAVPFLIVL